MQMYRRIRRRVERKAGWKCEDWSRQDGCQGRFSAIYYGLNMGETWLKVTTSWRRLCGTRQKAAGCCELVGPSENRPVLMGD